MANTAKPTTKPVDEAVTPADAGAAALEPNTLDANEPVVELDDADLDAALAAALDGDTSDVPQVQADDAGKIVISQDDLAKLVADQVAKALLSMPAPAAAEPQPEVEAVPESRLVNAAGRKFVMVNVTGNYVRVLNRHTSDIQNFEIQLSMPSTYHMGDLFRSLPPVLARKIQDFKRVREITSHEVVDYVKARADGRVVSDYVAPKPLAGNHVDAINRAEGVEGDDSQTTVNAGGVTVQLDQEGLDDNGLPRIINPD